MIESRHLQLVVTIAETGSLSKAAHHLNLTQSALSHQLRSLEDRLEIAVFHRQGSRLTFTAAGREVLDRARSILREVSRLEDRMAELRQNAARRYIHGYSEREARRLGDQAATMADLLHFDSRWPAGSRILEIGCGVGAQTAIIATLNPDCQIVAIDVSAPSLAVAKKRIDELGIRNVEFRQADIREYILRPPAAFDYALVCFLLEHLSAPGEVLTGIKSLLRPGGQITVIEGDHGTVLLHPDDDAARKLVEGQVSLQASRGGNANIGRALYPLLREAGYSPIHVQPRQMYVDGSKPELVEGFIRNTFIAMIEGMTSEMIQAGIRTPSEVEAGLRGLARTAAATGSFSYTFFRAVATASAGGAAD